MNNAIRTFIERHGLAAAAIDAERLLADFSSEMSAGLAGAPSSLAMIPSYISLGHPVPVGKPVIVLDAGGTNLRICVVAFDSEGKPQISHFTKVSMPGIAAPVTADEFFGILAGHIRPLIPLAKDIGFCFSYAAEISPDCDGRLIRWSKEVKAASSPTASRGASPSSTTPSARSSRESARASRAATTAMSALSSAPARTSPPSRTTPPSPSSPDFPRAP